MLSILEWCLAWYSELHAYDVSDVYCPSSCVQVLDSEWVIDLKTNTTTHMLELIKTHIVATCQSQIL